VAIQSLLKAGFLGAVQLELLFMIGSLQPVTNAMGFQGFRNFVPKHVSTLAKVDETRKILVKRDHGPPAEGAALKSSAPMCEGLMY